jgi:AraC-like DNA-binding protein
LNQYLIIQILYGAASIQGVFLAILLWRTKINQPANTILGLLLFILSFHLVLVGFDERDFFIALPHLSRISWIIGSLYGPLVFIFISRLVQIKVSPWIIISLFLPFIFLLIMLLPYYLQSAEEKRAYLDAFETARQDDFGWINQVVSILQVAFATGNMLFYLGWERSQSYEFSSPERVRINWLRQFLIFLLVIIVFGVAIFFGKILNISFLSSFYRYHFIGVVFLFYWLSYQALTHPVLFGITQPVSEPLIKEKVLPDEKVSRAKTESTMLNQVYGRVKEVMEKERLFLKSDLTLTELAQQCGYTRNLVSEAINSITQGNFFDFVNDFRIEEFKRQAFNPEKRHLSQLGIAQESGFNSKASFYSVFKKKTGMTPAEYLDQQKSKVNS